MVNGKKSRVHGYRYYYIGRCGEELVKILNYFAFVTDI